MTRPAILFGGPSPEHDISVLTGLQAVTALGKDGVAVIAVYWARSGDFFEVDATLAPSAFVEGVPAARIDSTSSPVPAAASCPKGGGLVGAARSRSPRS